MTPTERSAKILTFAAAALCLACCTPGAASAATTRPFVKQIHGTPTGAGGAEVPFYALGGIAVDGTGNLWVVNQPHEQPLEWGEFEAAGGFKSVKPEGHFPDSLAIEDSSPTGHFYATNLGEQNLEIFDDTGRLLNKQQVAQDAYVAVDNAPSTEALDPSRCMLSECTVYVSHGSGGPGGSPPAGVERFEVNALGEPTATAFTFTGSGSGSEFKYIEGDQIVGTPGGSFFAPSNRSPGGVAVDAHGNIYVTGEPNGNVANLAVYEYEPSGKFVRAFTGGQTPGLAGDQRGGGWGGGLQRVAVDSSNASSEYLLVSVANGTGTSSQAGAIDEFDVATGEYVGQITATNPKEPGAHLHRPEAVTVDSHGDLYVVDNTLSNYSEQVHVVDEYGPVGVNTPSVRVGGVSGQTSASAVLSGAVDPDGHPLGSCRFQYVTEAAYREVIEPTAGHPEEAGFTSLKSGGEASCSTEAGALPAGEGEEYLPVHAAISEHVVSGVTYRYRLVATTVGEGEAQSEALAFTAPAAPVIDSTSAGDLSSTFADLEAKIDPRGADTTYRFEYDTREYGEGEGPHGAVVPVPDGSIGSGGLTGSAQESVVQHIGPLAPATTYYFRVAATNEIEENGQITYGPETTYGENGTFTTLPEVVPGLPDNRAYELVTPANKGSAGDMFTGSVTYAGEFENAQDVGYPSESGDQFLLGTLAAFGPFPASGDNAYVFSRDPAKNDWKYTSLASPSLGVQSITEGEGVPVFDPADFSRVGVYDEVGSANSTAGASFTSLLGPPGGPYTTLHADAPVAGGEIHLGEETEIAGASHDLGDVVLQSKNHALASGAEAQDAGSIALYESTGGGECAAATGNCTLINVNSEGELLNKCGAVLGLGRYSLSDQFEAGSPFGLGAGNTYGKTHNAVSADGSRVFFTAPDPFAAGDGPECWGGEASPHLNAPQLYMRSGGETIEVSEPEAEAGEAVGGHHYLVQYVGASEDGSRVFFVTEAQLTKSDNGIHDLELYEYNVAKPAGERLTRVSAGEPGNPAAAGGAGVFAVPAISADGSAVYFLANGILAPGGSPGDCSGTGGACSLYRYDTATGATVYVATVAATAWTVPTGGLIGAHGRGTDPGEPWYTTPDGHYLLYKNGAELYRFEAPTAGLPDGELSCVSCDPSGGAPVSAANFVRSAPTPSAGGPVVAMSANGEYVFFDTATALVPQATNERGSDPTLDVYEWHNGEISLISPGNDPTPSFFLGYSSYVTPRGVTVEGGNVFFGTHAQLVPADQDSAGNLYDARICTAEEPCIKPSAGETAQCEGGSCQTPPAPPSDPAATLLAPPGPVGVASPPAPKITKKTVKCRKGLVRKRVKKKELCVKVKRKSKQAKKTNRKAK